MTSSKDQNSRPVPKMALPGALEILQLPNPHPIINDVVSVQSALRPPPLMNSNGKRPPASHDTDCCLVATATRSARSWEGHSPLVPCLPPQFFYYEQKHVGSGELHKKLKLDTNPVSAERQSIAPEDFTVTATNAPATSDMSDSVLSGVGTSNRCRICDEPGEDLRVVCKGCSHPYVCDDCLHDFVTHTISATGNGWDFSLACPESEGGRPHQLSRDWEHLAFLAGPRTLEKLHTWRRNAIKDWKWQNERQVACANSKCDNFIQCEPTYPPAQVATFMSCIKCGCKTCSKCEMLETTHDKDGLCETIDQATKTAVANSSTPCPKCDQRYEKDDGCNHMTCSCGTEFCYLCGVEYIPRGPSQTGFKKNCSCLLKEDTIDLDGDDDEGHSSVTQGVHRGRRPLPSSRPRHVREVGLKRAMAMIDCTGHKMGPGQAMRHLCNGCLKVLDTFACARCRGRLCLQCFTAPDREVIDLTDQD